MKIEKSLLIVIAAAIAVAAVPACTKGKADLSKKQKKADQKKPEEKKEETKPAFFSCPACGLG